MKIAARVTVNSSGDLRMSHKHVVGASGTVIRKTKGGLWRVRLDSGVEVSLPGRNLSEEGRG